MIIIIFHFYTYYKPIPYSYILNKLIANSNSVLTANCKANNK